MKNFNELRKDFVDDPELMTVLNGCASVKDIIDVFADKGYHVTEKDIEGFVEEKLPILLKECPELKEQLTNEAGTELNGNETREVVDVMAPAIGAGAVCGIPFGPVGSVVGALIGGFISGAVVLSSYC